MDQTEKVPICGAKMPSGVPCAAPPVSGKRRCHLHGGAPGSGAPKGNQNALTRGLTTGEQRDWLKKANAFFRELKKTRSMRGDQAGH